MMKNFFAFLGKLSVFLLAVSATVAAIGYFFNKKSRFFRSHFSKAQTDKTYE